MRAPESPDCAAEAEIEVILADAGKGDCVAIKFTGDSGMRHGVIFDSGPTSAARAFEDTVDLIKRECGQVDMVCITHQDEDHLGGLLRYLQHGRRSGAIREVWMNHDTAQNPVPSQEDGLLSAAQRKTIYQRAAEAGVPVSTHIVVGKTRHLDGATITVIAPTEASRTAGLVSPLRAEPAGLASRRDWHCKTSELSRAPLPASDRSPSNTSSIVVVFELGGLRALLTGDAPAEAFVPCLSAFGKPARFDLVKLPHHGSARNICESWTERISCNDYVICSDGTRHPDKQTVAKLASWHDVVTIWSARAWWEQGFSREEDEGALQTVSFRKASRLTVKEGGLRGD